MTALPPPNPDNSQDEPTEETGPDRSRDFRFRHNPPTAELAPGQPANPECPTLESPAVESKRPKQTLRQAIHEVSETFSAVRQPEKRQYAAAMALMGTSLKACAAIGINRGTPYSRQWREDVELQAALATAEQMYGQVLEAEIDRRAVEGIWKPTGWYKGQAGGFVKEYSDLLLIFRTKGLMREKYGDQVRLTGTFANLDVNQLSDDQVRRLAAGENPASVLSTQIPKMLPAVVPLPNVVAREGDG